MPGIFGAIARTPMMFDKPAEASPVELEKPQLNLSDFGVGAPEQLPNQVAHIAPEAPMMAPQMAPAPVVVPQVGKMGLTPTGQTETIASPSVQLTPKLEKQLQKADEAKIKANEAQATALTYLAEQDAQSAQQEANIAAESAARLSKSNAEYQQGLAEARSRVLKAQQDMDAYSLDQGNLYKDRGTLSKIGGAIAIAMNQYANVASGNAGAPNAAYNIIQNSINADIEKQKMEYSLRKGNVDAAKNAYAFAVDNLKDDVAANEMVRGAMLKDIIAQNNARMKANPNNPLLQTKLADLNANLEADLAKSQLGLAEMTTPKKQVTTAKTMAFLDAKGNVIPQVDPANVSKEQSDFLNTYKDIIAVKKYNEAAEAKSNFETAQAAGFDEAALLEFMVDITKKAPVNSDIADILKKDGFWGKTEDQLREKIKGGVDQDVVTRIGNVINKRYDRTIEQNKDMLAGIAAKSNQLFGTPDALMPGYKSYRQKIQTVQATEKTAKK